MLYLKLSTCKFNHLQPLGNNSFLKMGESSDSGPLSLVNPNLLCFVAVYPPDSQIYCLGSACSIQKWYRQTAESCGCFGKHDLHALHPNCSRLTVSDAATEHSGISSNRRNKPLAEIKTVSEGERLFMKKM